MVKHLILALTLAGLMCAVPAAIAQDNGGNAQQGSMAGGPPEHGHMRMDPEQRAKMLTKHLNLNSDQQTKVLDILKSSQSQMESLRSDTSSSQEDRRSKMMEIHKSTDEQIRGVLDSNQQKKWDEMQSKREQRMEHHKGQASPDSAPPQ
jgi:Spy/CpxP family protein refolding chaperone